MTKLETANIVGIIQTYYGGFYKNFGKEETGAMIDAWYIILVDYDFEEFQASLKAYIIGDVKGFPPVVGQIIEKLRVIKSVVTEELNELTAWGLVYSAICDSTYHARERYDEFPETIKKCIYAPEQLSIWGQLELSEVNTVIQSNFMRTFRGVQKHENDIKQIPKDIIERITNQNKEQIEETKQIGGKEK